MSRLHALRSQLGSLRRRRRSVRWLTAAAGFLLALLAGLFILFVIDWLFALSVVQRIGALVVFFSFLIWSIIRFALPFLRQRETLTDVALWVENKQQIDSDLVAALQFDSPESALWGSPSLRTAVIDYIHEFSQGLNVFEGFEWGLLPRRASWLSGLVVCLALVVGIFPRHASVFFNRLRLGKQHYPTRTTIDEVAINGHSVSLDEDGQTVNVVYGEPVQFQVRGEGALPASGTVKLVSEGKNAEVALEPAVTAGRFSGELGQIVEPAECTIYLGDAYTEPLRLRVIPLPNIDLLFTVTPPSYLGGTPVTTSNRQLSVAEGSRVDVAVTCVNKRLEKATLTLNDQVFAMTAADQKKTWTLASPTVLQAITDTVGRLTYEIQIRDEDGLALPDPIRGIIRIQPDHPPRIVGTVTTHFILPTATPKLMLDASDDHGIMSIVLRRKVVKGGAGPDIGSSPGDAAPVAEQPETQEDTVPLAIEDGPVPVVRKAVSLDLSSLRLEKGDLLEVTLQATDFRGNNPGKTADSEPIIFRVTDERGVLAAMAEADQRSARELDLIIERQLGIGESR